MFKYAVVAGALASLQGVSAQTFDSEPALRNRLQNKKEVGDQCHQPLGKYFFSVKGNGTAPPCIAEQGISTLCEELTGALKAAQDDPKRAEKFLAYQKCLTGPQSTYEKDLLGCLECKVQHEKLSPEQRDYWKTAWTAALSNFTQDKDPKPLWTNYMESRINWTDYNSLPIPSGGENVTAKPVGDYYKAPQVQGLGSFELNGRKYPEAALQDEGLLSKNETIRTADAAPLLIDVQDRSNAGADGQKPLATSVQPTTLVPVVSSTKLPVSNRTTTAAAAANTGAGASGGDVLVKRVKREYVNYVKPGPGLSIDYTCIIDTPQALAGVQPKSVSQQEANRLQLPDASDCQPCKQAPVALDSKQRGAAIQSQPAGQLGEQVCLIIQKASVSIEDRQKQVLNAVNIGSLSGKAIISTVIGNSVENETGPQDQKSPTISQPQRQDRIPSAKQVNSGEAAPGPAPADAC